MEYLAGGSALAVVAFVLPRRTLLLVALAFWSLNSVENNFLPGTVSLAVGAALAFVASFRNLRSSMWKSSDNNLRVAGFPIWYAAIGFFLLPAALEPAEALVSVAQVTLFAAVVTVIARAFSREDIHWVSFRVLFVLVVLSGFEGVFSGGFGSIGRWQGITGNPNSLGLLAGVFTCLAVGTGGRRYLFAVPLGAAMILMSGSRGASLATLVAVLWASLILVRSGKDKLGALVSISIMAIAAAVSLVVFLNNPSFKQRFETAGVGRGGDSGRVSAATNAWELFLQRPLAGYGAGVSSVDGAIGAHLFPLTLAVQLGVLGLVLFAVTVARILSTPWASDPTTGALCAFALISMASESWLFGGGAIWTLVFWLVLSTGRDNRTEQGENSLTGASSAWRAGVSDG